MRCRFSVWVFGVLWTVAVPALADEGQKGSVKGRVTVMRSGTPKGDLSGVVVYLETGTALPAAPAVPHTVKQKELAFEPAVSAIVKGTTVEFPNEDHVFHNVFSVSETAKFDLGLYKAGSSKSVKFQKAGVVDVFCNIHPQMVARVKVLDTPHYAITGKDGSFTITGVPEGSWPLVAWQAYGDELRQQVTVKNGKVSEVQLTVTEGSKPQWHMRKDGSPYGRYK